LTDCLNTTADAPAFRNQWRGGASPVKRAFPADRRRRPARRLAALTAALCAQLGRRAEDLDEVTRTRVAMTALLMLTGEELHARAAAGQALDQEQLVRVSGALARALADLCLTGEGLERRKAAEAEAERKRLLDQQFPNRTWDR
jgi:hypothetical protein